MRNRGSRLAGTTSPVISTGVAAVTACISCGEPRSTAVPRAIELCVLTDDIRGVHSAVCPNALFACF